MTNVTEACQHAAEAPCDLTPEKCGCWCDRCGQVSGLLIVIRDLQEEAMALVRRNAELREELDRLKAWIDRRGWER